MEYIRNSSVKFNQINIYNPGLREDSGRSIGCLQRSANRFGWLSRTGLRLRLLKCETPPTISTYPCGFQSKTILAMSSQVVAKPVPF